MTPRDREIKLASGDLVEALGGFEKAAAIVGKGKSQVHRCASVNDADSFLNARDVAELERRSAVPFVTRLMCKLAGGVFIKLPEDFGDGQGLPQHVMELAAEVGEVAARVSEALADGKLEHAELEAIETEYDQLIACAAEARATVQMLQGKSPREIVPISEARR